MDDFYHSASYHFCAKIMINYTDCVKLTVYVLPIKPVAKIDLSL